MPDLSAPDRLRALAQFAVFVIEHTSLDIEVLNRATELGIVERWNEIPDDPEDDFEKAWEPAEWVKEAAQTVRINKERGVRFHPQPEAGDCWVALHDTLPPRVLFDPDNERPHYEFYGFRVVEAEWKEKAQP